MLLAGASMQLIFFDKRNKLRHLALKIRETIFMLHAKFSKICVQQAEFENNYLQNNDKTYQKLTPNFLFTLHHLGKVFLAICGLSTNSHGTIYRPNIDENVEDMYSLLYGKSTANPCWRLKIENWQTLGQNESSHFNQENWKFLLIFISHISLLICSLLLDEKKLLNG